MKKIKLWFSLAVLATILTPLVMYAQDSTAIAFEPSGLLKTVADGVSTQYPIVGLIGTGLFVVSELLGSSKKVAANSVFQLVSGLLKSLFGK